MEKPLDVPLLLQTIRELLDEPLESRVRRASDPARGFRYAPCDSLVLREMLLKRLTTSYHAVDQKTTDPRSAMAATLEPVAQPLEEDVWASGLSGPDP